jgi:hypothetical protein
VKQQFCFRVYFSPSHYEVFVSTEDKASGIFLPDMQNGLERERKRNIGFQSNFKELIRN